MNRCSEDDNQKTWGVWNNTRNGLVAELAGLFIYAAVVSGCAVLAFSLGGGVDVTAPDVQLK